MMDPAETRRQRQADRGRQIGPWGLATAAGLIASVCSLTAFLGRADWVFELTSHFRVHYAASLLALSVICLWRRDCRWAVLFSLACLLNVGVLVAAWPAKAPGLDPDGERLRLMLLNVHTANTAYDRVARTIREADPDVVILLEVNGQWLAGLTALRSAYRTALEEPRDDNFGIALLSRKPVRQHEVIDLGRVGVPALAVRLDVGGSPLAVLAAHALPPGTREYFRSRNEQLAALSAWIRQQQDAVIVVGDLNVTPWSPYFRDLLKNSGLADTTQGRALLGTWPAWTWPLSIPIDHCLIGRGVRLEHRRPGPRIGSDHLPLIVDLRIGDPLARTSHRVVLRQAPGAG